MPTYTNPGAIGDVIGTTGRIEATWGNAIRDRVVNTFATTADRDSAIPSPATGQTCVVTAAPGTFYLHDGTRWLPFDLGWRTYTPTVAQGVSTNISKTVNLASYRQEWATCRVRLSLAITASGTAGSQVTATLPVTAAAGSVSGETLGVGEVNDASVQLYVCSVLYDSTSGGVRWRCNAAGLFGANPNVAIASGDNLSAQVTYPIF